MKKQRGEIREKTEKDKGRFERKKRGENKKQRGT
jgi:hypothetical protein